MNKENLQSFWEICEHELQKYTEEFNETMGEIGFQVCFQVIDKNPVGLG